MTTTTVAYRRPAPAEPSDRAYVSRYKRGHMVESNCHGLGGYGRTAWAIKGTEIYDPEKAYVASSWLFAHGTPEQEAHTGRFFRTPKAAQEWIRSVAVEHGFLAPGAVIVR